MSRGFRKKISMKLCYQYIAIFLNLSPTSSHLHPLQVENCDSNSRLVVDEDDNGKFRPESVKTKLCQLSLFPCAPEGCVISVASHIQDYIATPWSLMWITFCNQMYILNAINQDTNCNNVLITIIYPYIISAQIISSNVVLIENWKSEIYE